MNEHPKILILVGAARSCSTLAGLMLGQSGQFVYAGELNHIWDRGLGLDHLCGCGQHFSTCESWQRIISRAGLDGMDGQRRYDDIQRFLATQFSLNPLHRNKAFKGDPIRSGPTSSLSMRP